MLCGTLLLPDFMTLVFCSVVFKIKPWLVIRFVYFCFSLNVAFEFDVDMFSI